MKRYVAVALCISTLLTTSVFTNASDIGYDKTLSGTDFSKITCQVGNTKSQAILYKSRSYISLNDLQKLSLEGYDPIQVQYSQDIVGTLFDYKSFDILFSKKGEPVAHLKGEVQKGTGSSLWSLFLVFDGGCEKYTINNSTEFIISENNKLYIPLSFLRDICNIDVKWLGSDKGVYLSGENNMLFKTEVPVDKNLSNKDYLNLINKEKEHFISQTSNYFMAEYNNLTSDYERLHQSQAGYNLMMQHQRDCILKIIDNLDLSKPKESYEEYQNKLRILHLWLTAIANSPEEAYKSRTSLYDIKGIIVPYEVVIKSAKNAEDMYNASDDYVRACSKYFEVLCDELSHT